jgi:predicted lipase
MIQPTYLPNKQTFFAIKALRFAKPLLQDVSTYCEKKFLQNAKQYGYIHSDIVLHYEKHRNNIIKKIKAHAVGKIYICGFGFASGVALMCAMDIKPSACITVGAPKLVDQTFADNLSKHVKVIRVTSSLDIVTNLPPVEKYPRFVHVGDVVDLDTNDNSFFDDEELVLNHLLSSYIEKLETYPQQLSI